MRLCNYSINVLGKSFFAPLRFNMMLQYLMKGGVVRCMMSMGLFSGMPSILLFLLLNSFASFTIHELHFNPPLFLCV